MHKSKNVFTAVLLCLAALLESGAANPSDTAASFEPLRLALTEAVALAFEHNPAFLVERLKPAVSETFVRGERAAFDPALTAEFARSGSADDMQTVVSGIVSTNLDTDKKGYLGKAGLAQTLPTGTRLTLGAERLSDQIDWTPDPGAAHDNRRDVTRYNAALTQPLLRDFGPQVNLVRLRQARLDALISAHELRAVALALAASVEAAAGNCVLAERQWESYDESLKLAERECDEVRERILVGHLSDIELAAAEAEVAQRRESLINARSALSRRRLDLLRLIGAADRDGGWDRVPEIADLPFVPETDPDSVAEHVRIALAGRPEINEARLRIARGDLEIIRTRNGLLPRLDFFVTLGHTSYADTFSLNNRDVDQRENAVTAGLRLEYPPFTRAERAGHARAVLQREQAEAAMRNLEDLVQVDVRAAMIEVQRTREQIDATQATRRHREESLRAEKEKFRVGKSTTLLVAQAQRDLVVSRIAEVEAVINHLKARIELYRLDSSLLQKRGIELAAGG